MRINELRVGVVTTINLGDYNNLKVEAAVSGSPGEDEDTIECIAALQQWLQTLWIETYKEQKENYAKMRRGGRE